MAVEIGDELRALLEIYKSAEKELQSDKNRALDNMVSYMRNFLKAHDDLKDLSMKTNVLETKLKVAPSCGAYCEDEDEEEDDGDEE